MKNRITSSPLFLLNLTILAVLFFTPNLHAEELVSVSSSENACPALPPECPGDLDGDCICDDVDVCSGSDDAADIDEDGVPDGCDACDGYDDTVDSDGDGIPNGCDACPNHQGDNTIDTDLDGVPNLCDICFGGDDTIDSDSDGTPDACDVCPYDIRNDWDSDGKCADVDPCPYDNPDDSDGDGSCDRYDSCPGSDDTLDADLDGTPDGCDLCPGEDDSLDTDLDGVPDGCDACPEDADNDEDGDGQCGDVDPCPLDNPDDSDGDGACDTFRNTVIATWMKGSKDADGLGPSGVYGEKGIPHPDNTPSIRYGSLTWTDPDGNFWLYGDTDLKRNDLWKFDGEDWTWIHGGDELTGYQAPAVYGTRGVPHPDNSPGGRQHSSAATWSDAQGNLWLFGGVLTGVNNYTNDLWKFDGTSWTWMKGSNTGDPTPVYGELGIPHPDNTPGGMFTPYTWTDAQGDQWVLNAHGGERAWDGDLSTLSHDLWKFNGDDWSWEGTSYETLHPLRDTGCESTQPNGNPNPRVFQSSSTDSMGKMWVFGGHLIGGDDQFAICGGRLTDLWSFDGSAWTLESGSDLTDQAASYGTQGVPHPDNRPGPGLARPSWSDPDGNFWLFGGDENNILWRFDGTNWTWIRGSNAAYQPARYGTKGVSHPNNWPDARSFSNHWTDTEGNFWLFGGAGLIWPHNDLWKFTTEYTGDNCLGSYNPDQADTDGDLIGDACDNVPNAYNPDQDPEDADDSDLDGIPGLLDNCPDVYNDDQSDVNADDIGDACQCGDVTGNGAANNDDVTEILLELWGYGAYVNPATDWSLCDMTGDGNCNNDDVTVILMRLWGYEEYLPESTRLMCSPEAMGAPGS